MTSPKHVYELAAVDRAQMVIADGWEPLEQAMALAVSDDGSAWKPPRVHVAREDELHRAWTHSNLPMWTPQVLVLRAEAIDMIGPLLSPFGLIRPLDAGEDRLAVFGAYLMDGVLDEEASKIRRFPDGRVLALERPVFHALAVKTVSAFRLAEDPRGATYFTKGLIDEMYATGLAQSDQFRLVWRDT